MIPALNRHYDDIINQPRPTSHRRKSMPLLARAAQFAPFAALSGYDDAVQETARLTDRFIEPDEEQLAELNRQLAQLVTVITTRPAITCTLFEPDARKSGGAYRSVTGYVRRVDATGQALLLTDGTLLPFDRIHRLICHKQD